MENDLTIKQLEEIKHKMFAKICEGFRKTNKLIWEKEEIITKLRDIEFRLKIEETKD